MGNPIRKYSNNLTQEKNLDRIHSPRNILNPNKPTRGSNRIQNIPNNRGSNRIQNNSDAEKNDTPVKTNLNKNDRLISPNNLYDFIEQNTQNDQITKQESPQAQNLGTQQVNKTPQMQYRGSQN